MNSRAVFLALGLGITSLNAQSDSGNEASVSGVYCGSSPCDEPIRKVLRIPTNGEPELIVWKLTLYQDAKTQTPSHYELRCQYGLTAPNNPGLAKAVKTLDHKGAWTTAKGIKSNAEAVVYELDGAVSLFQVDADVLQVLNPDRSLMIGNGGWSYTLNRAERAEKVPDSVLTLSQPDMSYKISALATGPTVFGVFEGRSPCQGIARELKVAAHAGAAKVKWRVTLFQNPETLAPTTYKVESSLHRSNAREGEWTVIGGTQKDSSAVVYRLAPTEAEAAMFLLKGDDNVLFFLDQNRKAMVGNCEFSYTLNRRSAVSK